MELTRIFGNSTTNREIPTCLVAAELYPESPANGIGSLLPRDQIWNVGVLVRRGENCQAELLFEFSEGLFSMRAACAPVDKGCRAVLDRTGDDNALRP
jgi:hypothetical protein